MYSIATLIKPTNCRLHSKNILKVDTQSKDQVSWSLSYAIPIHLQNEVSSLLKPTKMQIEADLVQYAWSMQQM